MILSNLRQSFRSLRNQKGFAALNFLGLSTALTVCLLTGSMVFHERSFDSFHIGKERIFRVVAEMEEPGGRSEPSASPAVIVPGVAKEELRDYGQWVEVHHHDKQLVRLSSVQFFEEQDILFVDTSFLDVFNFETKTNGARAALSRPNQVLLTETTAAKYFPGESPLGKRLSIEAEDCPSKAFEVAGVVADAPSNSHLPFRILVSAPSLKPPQANANWDWFFSGRYLYLKTAGMVDASDIGPRLTQMANARKGQESESTYTYRLQPLSDIHTNLDYAPGNAGYTVDFDQFYWLGIIALFLLLIAAVNYINLSTAIAQRKAREVGVRKTLGATRGQLAGRFWIETFLVVAAAALAATVMANGLLPVLNKFLDRNIVVHWISPHMLGLLGALCALTTLAAGLYPALVMAGFSPVQAFRGKISNRGMRTSLTLRRGLVMFQFFVAQVFLAAVIVSAVQMQFIRSKPLGFRRDGVLNIRTWDLKPESLSAFRSEVERIPGVLRTTRCIGAPTSASGFSTRFNLPERYEQDKLPVNIKIADANYLETYGLQLLTGRFLSDADMAQSAEKLPQEQRKYACVLNETAVRKLGFAAPEDALGQTLKLGANDLSPTVIGVVRDFHTRSLHEPIPSTLIIPHHDFNFALGIRLDPAAANAATLEKIESAWKQVFPADLFVATFLDDYLATLYRDEGRVFSIFKLVTMLALLINALGLIGLTVFIVEAKTKEIGIRKVLGASIGSIANLLVGDFLKLVLVAFVVASPVAYYFMQKWLSDFTYRIDLQWWMFAIAGASAILVAFLTVGFQSLKAALANPVQSLRNE